MITRRMSRLASPWNELRQGAVLRLATEALHRFNRFLRDQIAGPATTPNSAAKTSRCQYWLVRVISAIACS